MRKLADEWSDYENSILSAHAGQTQRIETRRAFYAGAHSILMGLLDAASESGNSDDIGATMLENLHRECRIFVLDVAEGRA